MFQRIARRTPDGSEEPVPSEASPAPPAEAPTERIDAVAAQPDADQPTAFQPAVTASEQPTVAAGAQPATSVPPPARTLTPPPEQPAGAAGTPAPVAAAAPATGAPAPAPADTTGAEQAQHAPRRPGFRARGRMRRRLRYLRKLRELQVRDVGGLVFDLRRFERKRDDLVAQKVDQIRACDDELRALEQALDERRELRDVREPGVGGTCPRCFAIYGSADKFCANCGAAFGGAVQGPAAQIPLAPQQASAPEAGGPGGPGSPA